MTSKKERRKERKNTDKLIDDAWDALASGQDTLAERLGRRAVENGFMNPRVGTTTAASSSGSASAVRRSAPTAARSPSRRRTRTRAPAS